MKLLNKYKYVLIIAIMELVIGILLLIDYTGFTKGIIMTVGLLMAIRAGLFLFSYFRTKPQEAAGKADLFMGLMFLTAGIFCIMKTQWFFYTFPLLTNVYGAAQLVLAMLKIQWSVDELRLNNRKWFFRAITAIISLIGAVVILTEVLSTIPAGWTFIGVSLIVEAVFDILGIIMQEMKMVPRVRKVAKKAAVSGDEPSVKAINIEEVKIEHINTEELNAAEIKTAEEEYTAAEQEDNS